MPVKLLKKGMKGEEVKHLQRLLQKNLKLKESKFIIDGDFGKLTDKSLRVFQKKAKLTVDGKAGPATFGALSKKGDSKSKKFAEQVAKKAPKDSQAKSGGAAKPPDGHTSRSSFVGSKVKENSVSKKIIDQIYTYFPKKYKVISAYLTAGDLYWKVNYHWDAMRVWLEYAKDHTEMSEDEQKQLNSYYETLMSNQPSKLGHYKIDTIGKPADSSSESKIESRCASLKKTKKSLTSYANQQKFTKKNLKKKGTLDMALNPLAMPGKSNHLHGWALDIAGDIKGAEKIADSLGATMSFKERTHCHCEFKNGVKLPK